MPHPLSHKYPISIPQLCLVNTDVPAGVGAPPLDTIPKTQVYLCEFHREQAWERHTDGTMTLFQTTFVSVPVKSFTAWREKAAVTEDDILMKDLTTGKFTLQGSGKVHTIDFGVATGHPSCSCPDWLQWHIPCKHFFWHFPFGGGLGMECTPRNIQKSAHLSVDSTALSKQHSLSQPLSSGDVTELGSTSDENFKSPL